MVQEALKASKELDFKPTIVNVHTIKPLDEKLLIELANTHEIILTCEEHSIINGLGSAVCETLAPYNLCKIFRLGINDTFGESGTPIELLEKYGLNAKAIISTIKEITHN